MLRDQAHVEGNGKEGKKSQCAKRKGRRQGRTESGGRQEKNLCIEKGRGEACSRWQ